MTKARGAFDSIGKAGRGASFLLPAFSPYYAPYFPLFLCTYVQHCTQMHTSTHVHVVYVCNILCPEKHTFTRVLLFFLFFSCVLCVHHVSYLLSLSVIFIAISFSFPMFLTLSTCTWLYPFVSPLPLSFTISITIRGFTLCGSMLLR